ncbi:MAG: hypothetical protein KDI44_06005 [Thiothrix sp.]|nr:hypothetical protein [Thiothrix sp.]HPQ95816.1 hypothetical protein [Thiolinea sp.]
MKPVQLLPGVLSVLLLAGCASDAGGLAGSRSSPADDLPAVVASMTACTTAKSPECSSRYYPVCGVYQSSGRQQRKTYDNACTACSSANVLGFTPGEC